MVVAPMTLRESGRLDVALIGRHEVHWTFGHSGIVVHGR